MDSYEIIKQLAKKLAPPTKAQQEFLNAAVVIRTDTDAVERAFMARQLVLCTLPHSDPGDAIPRWLRRTGNSSLIIQPGWDGQEDKSTPSTAEQLTSLGTWSNVTINGGTLGVTAGFTLTFNRGVALGASNGTIDVSSGQTFIVAGGM